MPLLRPLVRPASRAGAGLTAALAAAVVLAPAPVHAATRSATSAASFVSAASGCVDGDVIRMDADFAATSVTVACTATLDLAGRTIPLNGVLNIASGKTLTITDSVGGSKLTIRTAFDAGIGTAGASLVVNAGTLDVEGGQNSAGIGGGPTGTNGSVTIEGTANVTAKGGASTGGAGIGGGFGGSGGSITIRGSATVVATGIDSGAGLGGGSNGFGGTITIGGSANVTANGSAGAGIGGGSGQSATLISISGTPVVTARASMGAAIGGGLGADGPTINISGGTISAAAPGNPNGEQPSAIGGGNRGAGGTVTISGDTTVVASSGYTAAAIGGGRIRPGGALTISAPAVVTTFGGNAVGNAVENGQAFGSLQLSGTLKLGDASSGTGLQINDAGAGDEVTILPGGRIIGGLAGADGSTNGAISGTGSIRNGGAITLVGANVNPAAVGARNYRIDYDARGGAAVASTRLFASTFTEGSRVVPTPTRAGYSFLGWNTAADGSGSTLTTDTVFAGVSTGTPIATTYYAQWKLVPTPPTITGDASAAGVVGTAFTYTPTLTGAPTPTVTTASALPPGVTLDPATGTLSGTPTAAGTYPVTLTATNASGTADLAVSITTTPAPAAPTLTGPATADGVVGTLMIYRPTYTGYPEPTVSVIGALPPGLILASDNTVQGTPANPGVYPFTLRATNASGSADLPVTITVTPAPAAPTITGAASRTAVVDQGFAYTPTVGGYPAPTVTASLLPPGVVLDPATGALSGTPSATGVYPVELTATNASGTARLDVTITVASAPSISAPGISGEVGTPLLAAPTLGGFPAPRVTTSSPLPPGLTLDPVTGALSGTPTTAGDFPVVLVATNAAGSASTPVVVSIAPAPAAQAAAEASALAASTAARCSTARRIVGTARADRLRGSSRADTIRGRGGADVIAARGGADCVFGGTGRDRIKGGSGADRIDGGRGRDRIDAGAGDDIVLARDGVRDVVVCGAGTDTVIADAVDVLRGCENRVVTRLVPARRLP